MKEYEYVNTTSKGEQSLFIKCLKIRNEKRKL